ncbi:MAG: substrate-binding domain-containing protein [Actinomycetota bacterium]
MTGLLAVLTLLVSACASSGGDRVVVAAGTTVVDSGLVEYLTAAYVEDGGRGDIDVIALSSQQSLAYATAGNADITITHEKDLLTSFLSETPAAVSSPVFASRFGYVASPDLRFPLPTVESILETVASEGIVFASRDDGSGTYSREVAMWNTVGVDPTGEPWYVRTGTGMGDTLLVTDQRGGVTLAEIGAYLAAADELSLVPVDDGSDPRLVNPYDITVVDPPGNEAAVEFFAWLTSEPGREAIVSANEELFGTSVYQLP